ncbi:MAG: cytochrome-c peroxidase, partial [Luteolibacter sp.]
EDGVLDLTRLENYANQSVPTYITRDNTTAGNAVTDKGATLGRVLFYDKRLSRNDSISCSSCHVQSRAFGDTDTASTGVNGTTGRHSMRLINARFSNEARFFWDERAATLENQTSQPIQDHVEMGFSGTAGDPSFGDLVTKLSAIDDYRVLFAMTFGDATINETRVQQSLAQFVRSIQSFDSRYDVGRARTGNNNAVFPNFTVSENNGKQLFNAGPGAGGAGCATCHTPPEFSIDPLSRNNGVTASIGGGTDLTNTRSPSLRDLVGPGGQSNGAFMHHGGFAAIIDVINHYDAIPADNPNLDNRLRRPGGNVQDLNLSATQKTDLAAFLRTLTGSAVYTAEKWSDPFDASNQLSLIVLPQDAVEIIPHGDGTATIACQAAAGLHYQLQSSTDLKTWSHVTAMTSDATGRCEYAVAVSGNTFYRYTYEPPAR